MSPCRQGEFEDPCESTGHGVRDTGGFVLGIQRQAHSLTSHKVLAGSHQHPIRKRDCHGAVGEVTKYVFFPASSHTRCWEGVRCPDLSHHVPAHLPRVPATRVTSSYHREQKWQRSEFVGISSDPLVTHHQAAGFPLQLLPCPTAWSGNNPSPSPSYHFSRRHARLQRQPVAGAACQSCLVAHLPSRPPRCGPKAFRQCWFDQPV